MMWSIEDQLYAKYETDRFNCWPDGRQEAGVAVAGSFSWRDGHHLQYKNHSQAPANIRSLQSTALYCVISVVLLWHTSSYKQRFTF